MNQSNLIDVSAVMPAAIETGLFDNALVTIQQPTGILTLSGAPDLTSGPNSDGYVDVAGMIDILCMLAPDSIASIRANEQKTATETQTFNSGHCLLSGFYPQIENQTDWRAAITISGLLGYYGIEGAESDSQGQMTRLRVQVATV
jgi:hypothetical protein